MINPLINDVNDEAYLLPGHMVHVPQALKPIFPYLFISKMSLFILLSFKGEGLDFFYELSTFWFINIYIVHNNTLMNWQKFEEKEKNLCK